MYSCGIQQIEPILGSFVRASSLVLMVRINCPITHESQVLMVITHDIVALVFLALMERIDLCFLRNFVIDMFRLMIEERLYHYCC